MFGMNIVWLAIGALTYPYMAIWRDRMTGSLDLWSTMLIVWDREFDVNRQAYFNILCLNVFYLRIKLLKRPLCFLYSNT